MQKSHHQNRRRSKIAFTAALLFVGTCVVAPGLAAETRRVEMHGASGDSQVAVQLSADEVAFEPVAGKPGVYSANIVGNPGTTGVYVVLVKMDKGASNAPHTHPDGRATTVISGKVRYGLGDRVIAESSRVYGPGSFYYTPPNTPHYLTASEGEVVYQEVGMGPSASVPVPTK